MEVARWWMGISNCAGLLDIVVLTSIIVKQASKALKVAIIK